MTLVVRFDAAAPPADTWGPMLVVGLVVVAVVAMILGFGRISRARRGERATTGTASPPETTASDDELPTDPE